MAALLEVDCVKFQHHGSRYGGPYCHWTVPTADIIQGSGTPEPDGRCSGSNEPPESNLPVQGCVLQHYQEFSKFL